MPRKLAAVEATFPDPVKTDREDAEARRRLRNIFEESAGSARESLCLLDVSSNIDHLGVGWGHLSRDKDDPSGSSFPLQINDLALVTPARHARLFLLPQFQWEPLRNVPNPNIGFFPDRLVSGDDGGATLFGAKSVRLVPILPDRVLLDLVDQFNNGDQEIGASFTLPFGIRAAARLKPWHAELARWAEVHLNQPVTGDNKFRGSLQIKVTSHSQTGGIGSESPSLEGAAWQTRNAVDPISGVPNGFSALRGDVSNEGVEAFFNNELGPASANRRVPVTRRM